MRITNFRHIVPVPKIDITVGTQAPRLAEKDRTATVPQSGDIQPLGRQIAERPQRTAPVRTISLMRGFVVDVFA